MNQPAQKGPRYALGALLLLLALNAFGGGYYGMAGAEGVPVAWLRGSPFRSYFIPSLVLFVVVGGTALFAGIAVLRQRKAGRKAAVVAALVVLVWLAVQVAVIGYVSWMQPATATAAIVILVLAWQLKK